MSRPQFHLMLTWEDWWIFPCRQIKKNQTCCLVLFWLFLHYEKAKEEYYADTDDTFKEVFCSFVVFFYTTVAKVVIGIHMFFHLHHLLPAIEIV